MFRNTRGTNLTTSRKVVALGRSLVNDRDGDSQPGGVQDRAVAGLHRQRRSEHRQQARRLGQGEALGDPVTRHVLVHPPGSTKYRFRHALMCEAAYADLLPGTRKAKDVPDLVSR